jgi:hypothetical protein
MASDGMIFLPSFMQIGADAKPILRFNPSKVRGWRGWYYWWEGFKNEAVEMRLGGMICIPSFIKIGSVMHEITGRGYKYRHAEKGRGFFKSTIIFSK